MKYLLIPVFALFALRTAAQESICEQMKGGLHELSMVMHAINMKPELSEDCTELTIVVWDEVAIRQFGYEPEEVLRVMGSFWIRLLNNKIREGEIAGSPEEVNRINPVKKFHFKVLGDTETVGYYDIENELIILND